MSIQGKKLIDLTTDSLLQIFGKPDTIYSDNALGSKTRGVGFAGSADYWVYGNTVFLVRDDEDCWLVSLDFNSTDVVVETPFINLKKGMSIPDIQKAFPCSSSLMQMSGNALSGTILIPSDSHTGWNLYFHKEALHSITYIN